MIEFKNVSVERSGMPVLTDLSFHALRGSMTVIFGASGSGKSTICDLLLGKMDAQSGTVHVSGEKPSSATSKVGLIASGLSLLSDRSIEENIALPLEISGIQSKRKAAIVSAILQRFGLESVRNNFPSAVSGSVRQKSAIARAVASEPFVLVADEPTLHLDTHASKEIAEALLKEQVRGMTVLVLTSDSTFKEQFPNATHITL
jgi:cell division transport system ATP-binding protein